MADEYARPAGLGFIAVANRKPGCGEHFIRAAHITSIQHIWSGEMILGSYIYTLDGRCHSSSASFDQITDAMNPEGRVNG